MAGWALIILQGVLVLKFKESQGLLLQESDVESMGLGSRWSKFVIDDFDQLIGSR